MDSRKTIRPKFAAIAAALAVPAALAGTVLTAVPAQARMNVHCAGSSSAKLGTGDAWSAGTATVDPIVSRGSQISMHEHQFFGNLGLLNMERPDLANCADMTDGDASSCNMQKDTASYWAPTLRYTTGPNAGQLVPIKRYEMYYQSWNDKTTDPFKRTTPFPADLRMVAGNPMAQSAADANINAVSFSCGNFSSKAARTGSKFATPQDARCDEAYDTKPDGYNEHVFLTVFVLFPTCWTGQLNDHTIEGNTADFMGDPMFTGNQVAYTVRGQCPSGFPVKLPKARFVWQWDYRGDGSDIAFSSGMDAGLGQGFTFHADFWNTWDQTTLQNAVNTCINTTKDDKLLHIGNTPKNPGLCGIPVP